MRWIICVMLLALAGYMVYGSGRVEHMNLCKLSSGEAVESFFRDGFPTKGTAAVSLDDLAMVIPMHGHQNCVLIAFKNGQQAAVRGSFDDIMCRWRGGCWCKPEGGKNIP